MLTKQEWLKEQKRKFNEYRKKYSDKEIAMAFVIAHEMGVSYLDNFKLDEARKRLTNK
jgi:hypothetical protein